MPNISCDRRPGTIALLTGGWDKPYALGLASALTERGICIDFIGSDDVCSPDLMQNRLVNFLNLRGDQSPDVPLVQKCWRVLLYYARLVRYAAAAEPKVFHILWNNKVELLDRLLLVYYKLLGKKILFTAHNVNVRKRDGKDHWLNRLSLKFQYRMVDGLFVHTEKMRDELTDDFGVPPEKITVIPFGVNSTVSRTAVTPLEAKQRLGLDPSQRVLLFFGNIAPYKGLEYLTDSLATLVQYEPSYRLIIAGKPKNCAAYWSRIKRGIAMKGIRKHIVEKCEYIPDEEVELYFKAADVLILPYTHIFQSGVLFLSYSFGLPVIAADVGSLREDVVEGVTGYVFRARDSVHLASVVESYFQSELYKNPAGRRETIRCYASERNSWTKVGEITQAVYEAYGPKHEAGDSGRALTRIVNDP